MANVHVNLLFEANTQNAINNINQLGQLLNQIGSKTTIGVESGSLNQAAQAARELQVHLGNAVNVNTGKLDLTKLNSSLKQSNQSLGQLSGQLVAAGTTGQQAFVKLANSIAQAQVPAFKLGGTIGNLVKTMGTAIMWTAAYGAIDAMGQAFEGAIDYAKDLNKALTDIAIVSKLSEKQLAQFAKTASKAAKELKTTTTAYAEAALIFYQQGLSGAEVEERANAVIKMAHVTGQTAETVSDQMTAVWNNFDNGTKSLEYYVDVLTALGAATASSTDEITEGLEKFAAVAETVGLSYEYAATALATVTAQTRQSADVVGTAFKTLFARIQDLELGNTLEDGVTLGQYAQALNKIGVSALDSNGNLREMNDILDDMGAKWDTLTKAQQTATAQSVAGVRQYTQLIALMDNWDTFQVNLEIAEGSEGALEEQHDKWAESAEAAGERVKESMNQVYSQLLDDDTVIGFTNTLAGVLSTIANTIDAMHGFGPMLLMIAGIFGKTLIPMIASWAMQGLNSFNMLIGMTEREIVATQQLVQEDAAAYRAQGLLTEAQLKEIQISGQLAELKMQLAKANKFLTQSQKDYLNNSVSNYEAAVNNAKALREEADAAQQAAQQHKAYLKGTFSQQQAFRHNVANQENGPSLSSIQTKPIEQIVTGTTSLSDVALDNLHSVRGAHTLMNNLGINPKNMQISIASLEQLHTKLGQVTVVTEQARAAQQDLSNSPGRINAEYIDSAKVKYESLLKTLGLTDTQIKNAMQSLNTSLESAGSQEEKAKILENAFGRLGRQGEAAGASMEILSAQMRGQLRELGLSEQELDAYANAVQRAAQGNAEFELATQSLGQRQRELQQIIADNEKLTKGMGTLTKAVSGFAMALSAVSMLRDALDFSSDMDPMQRFTQLLMGLSMMLPVLASSFELINKARQKGILAKAKETIATMINTKANKDNAKSNVEAKVAQEAETRSKKGATKANIEEAATENLDDGPSGGGNNLPPRTLKTKGGINMGTALSVIGIVAVAIATIALFVNMADKAWNKTKNIANDAAEGAKNLEAQYQKANEEHQKLVDNISSYEDGLASLSKLTAGTAEYNDQLEKNNQTALELINTYDTLAGKYEVIGGMIVFQDNALEDLQKEQAKEKVALQNATILAKQNAREAKINYNKETYARNNMKANSSGEWNAEDDTEMLTGGAIGVGAGAAVGAGLLAAGLISNPVGWAILAGGAIVGLIGGALTEFSDEATQEEMREIDKVYEAYSKSGAIALETDNLEKLLGTDSPLIKSLDGNTAELQKLMGEMKAEEERQRAERELRAANFFSAHDDNWNTRDTEQKDFLSALGADLTEYFDQGYKEESVADYSDNWITYGRTGLGEQVFKEYVAEAYADQRDIKIKNFGETGVDYEYLDENNQKQTGKILYSEMSAWRKEVAESEELASKQAEMLAYQQSLLNQGIEGQGVMDVIMDGSITALNQEEYEQFANSFFSGELGDEIAAYGTIMGEGAAEALEEELRAALSNWTAEDALSAYQEKVESEITSMIDTAAQKLETDSKALKAYAQSLMITTEALHDYGDGWEYVDKKKAAAQLAITLTKFSKGISELNKAMSENIGTLADWDDASIETWEAVAEIQTALEGVFGVEVSGQFVKQYLGDIQKLAEGDISVLEELERAAAFDYVDTSGIAEKGKNALNEILTTISDFEAQGLDTIEIEAALNDEDMINKLSELVVAGDLTAEQVTAALGAIGYTPDIKYTTVEQPTTTEVFGPNDKLLYKLVQKNTVTVPYIAGSNSKAVNQLGDYSVPEGTTLENGRGITAGATTEQKAAALGALRDDVSEEQERTHKKLDEEIDKYYYINAVIDDLSREYDILSKAKDRAFGPDKMALMDLEIAKTKEMIEAQKQLVAEMEQDVVAAQANIIAQYGASIDEYGRITNYEEMFATYINAYSAHQISDEAYDQFTTDIKNYKNSLDKLEKAQSQLLSQQYQAIDEQLEKIEIGIDYTISLTEDALRSIKFQLDNLTDSVDDAVKKFDLLGKKMAQGERVISTYQNAVRDTFLVEGSGFTESDVEALFAGDMSILEGKTLTEAQIKSLREYSDALLKQTQELLNARDEISETLLTSFEDMNKELDKSVDYMEHLNSLSEKYRNIIDLIGVEASGINKELLSDIAKTQYAVAAGTIGIERAQLEQNQAALAVVKAELDAAIASGADEGAIKELQEAYDEMLLTVQDDKKAFLDSIAAGLEAATAIFEEEMNHIVGVFEDAMTGAYGTFAAMEESFEQQKKLSDLYLDDYQKIYELSKLNRDINNSINDNDSIVAKTKLRDLQAEINELQASNTQMTQYEVDHLRAKYDLRLAEIALEEAQNAKSQVRMSRDSEGNWNYVYTADQDAIEGAEQSYEDKLYAMQQLEQEYTQTIMDQLVTMRREYAEAIQTIYEDQTLRDEERNKRLEETEAYYRTTHTHLIEQMGIVNADAAELYNTDWLNYSNATGYKMSSNEAWVDNFNETIYAQMMGYDDLSQVQIDFEIASTTMLENLEAAYGQYREDVDGILDEAGVDMESFVSELQEHLNTAETEANEAKESAEEMGKANAEAFEKAVNAATEWLDDYSGKISEWCGQNQTLVDSINDIIEAYQGTDGKGGLFKTLDDLAGKYENVYNKAKLANGVTGVKNQGITELSPYDLGTDEGPTASFRVSDKLVSNFRGDAVYVNPRNISLTKNEAANISLGSWQWNDPNSRDFGWFNITLPDGTTAVVTQEEAKDIATWGGWYDQVLAWQKQESDYTHAKFLGTALQSYQHGDKTSYSVQAYDENFEPLVGRKPVDRTKEYQIFETQGDYVRLHGLSSYEDPWTGWQPMWFKKSDLTFLDTGGYTGSWDSSGRLAMLHQKELVLNAEDTVNFLDAVGIVRQIAQAIDLNAVAQAMQMGNLRAAQAGPMSQTLEQEVTIHAEFPNATNRTEIEEAFDSLLNRASQYANRKN